MCMIRHGCHGIILNIPLIILIAHVRACAWLMANHWTASLLIVAGVQDLREYCLNSKFILVIICEYIIWLATSLYKFICAVLPTFTILKRRILQHFLSFIYPTHCYCRNTPKQILNIMYNEEKIN